MAFHHSTTFLRSALARDPFCHGDIITAEDVIRLEAKFPALFDKPVSSPRGDDASDVTSEDDFHFEDTPRRAMSTVSTSKPIPKKQTTRSGPISVVKARPKPFSGPGSGPTTRKPVICRYHQKCFSGAGDECRTEVERRSNEIVKPASEKVRVPPRRLIRPSQSLEDLRETLKQVLEEEEQRPKTSRQYGTRSLPSPYTEDLVKKFFGKKLEELRRQRMQVTKGRGQGRELVNAKSTVRPSQNPNPPKKVTHEGEHTSKRTENVQRVGSASSPGFIRGSNELPRAPPPKLGVTYQSKRTNSGLNVSGNKTPRTGKPTEGLGNRQLTWVGSQNKSIDSKRLEGTEKYHKPDEKSEDSDNLSSVDTDTDDKRAAIRDTRVIHLTCPKHLCKPEVRVHQELPKSSYHQLLAARQATGNLETKAMLRKQECADKNFSMKRMERMQDSHYSIGYESEDTSFQLEDRHRFQVERKTSETLEKIAGELVYTEILHQLNELKLEQGTRQKVNRGPVQSKSDHSQLSPSSSEQDEKPEKVLPNFIPTTATEGEDDESKGGAEQSASEIVLKTPDLTPTSTEFDKKGGKAVRDDEETDFSDGSLNTPELSPRSPRNPVAHPSQGVQMKSEVLDFVPSQHSHSMEYRKKEPKDNAAKEPEGLKTPQLSHSLHIIPNPPGWNDNAPERDESTLSGIDTFSESVHHAPDVDPDAKIAADDEDKTIDEEDKIPSKYSDDFIPEMGSNGDSPPAPAILPPPPGSNDPPPEPSRNPSSSVKRWLSEADSDNEDVLENLNTSRETVIDMLSEGEFIGDVLKSPGELSIRQKWAPTEKLVSPKKGLHSEQVSSSLGMATESTLNGERTRVENEKLGEYVISIISEGAQLLSMDRDQDPIVGTSLGEIL